MKKPHCSLFIFFMLLGLLQAQEIKPYLKAEKEIQFNLGYYPQYIAAGVYVQPETYEEYFYFTHFTYRSQRVDIFNALGERVDTFDLSPLKGKFLNEGVLQLISLDKLVVTSSREIYYVIDKKGTILHSFKFNDLIEEHRKGNKYQTLLGKIHSRKQKDYLYIYPFWVTTDSLDYGKDIMPLAENDYPAYLDLRIEKTRTTPFCYEVQLNDSLTVKPIFSEYNDNLLEKDHYKNNLINPGFDFDEEHILIISKYSDSLWKINLTTNEVQRFLIQSKNVKFNHKPINLNTTSLTKKMGLFLQPTYKRAAKSSLINNVLYDRFNQFYYVFAKYALKTSEGDDLRLDYGFEKKVILIYDKNMNLLNEVILPKGKYRSLAYVGKEGLYISTHIPSKKNYNPNVYTFDLFKVEM